MQVFHQRSRRADRGHHRLAAFAGLLAITTPATFAADRPVKGSIPLPEPVACRTDLDGDGTVAFGDVLAVLSEWGSCSDGGVGSHEAGAVTTDLGFYGTEVIVSNSCEFPPMSEFWGETVGAPRDFESSISRSVIGDESGASAHAEQYTFVRGEGIVSSGAIHAQAGGCSSAHAYAQSFLDIPFIIEEPQPIDFAATLSIDGATYCSIALRRDGETLAERTTPGALQYTAMAEPGSYYLAVIIDAMEAVEEIQSASFSLELVTDLTGRVPCPADVDDSGGVGLDDLLAVLATWGPCR